MKNKIKVTIGVPVHNEEKNIGNLLNKLLMQKNNFYDLECIYVVCDACTDNTALIVKQLIKKSKKIKLYEEKKRLGKVSRLNQLFNISNSKILVLIDGDNMPKNNMVMDEIVKKFNNKQVVLVGGHDTPVPAKGFMEKVIVAGVHLWFEVRNKIEVKDNIHYIHANIFAFHKNLYKKFTFPTDIVNDDNFAYLKMRQLGYESSFAKKAVVFYQAPDNFADFFKQAKRFFDGCSQFERHFGLESIRCFKISKRSKFFGTINFLKKEPFYGSLAILLQLSLHLLNPIIARSFNDKGIWSQVTSTKKAIKI